MPRLIRSRRGFSLTELLVVLGILGVIGTVIAQLMLGQQRFYQRANVQMDMRRELRSAMSLVPADLRSVSSSGGDLIDFSSTSITFRAVVGASIVCNRPANNAIDLPPVDMARNRLTSWLSEPQIGDTVWAFNDSLSRGAEDDVWTPLRVTDISTSVTTCLGAPFLDPILDVGKLRYRLTVSGTLPDSVRRGAALRFTRTTRYALEAQSGGAGYLTRAEYRAGAWTDAVPVSGPYAAPTSSAPGIRFAMFDSLGGAVTDPAQGRRVSRIDLLLRAAGERSSGLFGAKTTTNSDSTLFRIALRNRQ